jgi:Tfp pilus assembly protein FimT
MLRPMSQPPHPPTQAGFGLLEQLLAVGLLSVLLGLGLPSFAIWRAEGRVAAAADRLSAALALARATALAQGQRVDVCLQRLPDCRHVGAAAEIVLWLASPTPTAVRTVLLPTGVRVFASRQRSSFYPWPRDASSTSFTLCDEQRRARPRRLVVSQTGRVREERGTAAACP